MSMVKLLYFLVMAILWNEYSAASVGQATERFSPAVFAGLTLGRASVTDCIRKLGKPADQITDNSGIQWLYYKDIGGISGNVEVLAEVNTGTIDSVVVYPTSMSLEELHQRFGRNYQIVRYAHDLCLERADGAPMYEDKNGPLEYFVYAKQSIAVQQESQTVTSIQYLKQPLGRKQSRCRPKKGQ